MKIIRNLREDDDGDDDTMASVADVDDGDDGADCGDALALDALDDRDFLALGSRDATSCSANLTFLCIIILLVKSEIKLNNKKIIMKISRIKFLTE